MSIRLAGNFRTFCDDPPMVHIRTSEITFVVGRLGHGVRELIYSFSNEV